MSEEGNPFGELPNPPKATTVQQGEGHIQTPNFTNQQSTEIEMPEFSDVSQPNLDNFNAFQQQNFQQTPLNGGTQGRYKILDMFWLINEKMISKSNSLEKNEAQFVTLSFNITFGNMRITFYNLTPGAVQGHVVFHDKLEKLVVGTIYPAGLFKMGISNGKFRCIEQLISRTDEEWQKNRPACDIDKSDERIKMTIHDHQQGSYVYEFTGWQKEALLHAVRFSISNGFVLTGKNIIATR